MPTAAGSRVAVIGSSTLVQRYSLALRHAGGEPIAFGDEATWAGHQAIYVGGGVTLARAHEELAEFVQRSRLAGLVLTAPMSERPDLVAALVARGIRVVRIIAATDDPGDGPCVYIDDRDAAYEITEHLIQLGHQRIGFLWGGAQHRSSGERYAGYEAALKDYGIALDKHLVVPGDYTFDDGFRGARRLLALREPPTAIFGSNDEIAAGVLAAAKSVGLNVPYDLSIAGFEDSPFSRQSWPALTTAKQATEEIARHAARLLIGGLRQDAYDDHPLSVSNQGFVPQLVVRGSTAPAPLRPRASTPPEA